MTDPTRESFDDRLRDRLERLSAAIPVDPPLAADRNRAHGPWRPRSWRVVGVAAMLVTLLSLSAAAVLIEIGHPTASSSAFAAGGVLHCSRLDQLPPPEAATWLAQHGLATRWQVEDRAQRTFDQTMGPPAHGAIIDALALSDGTLLVLVDAGRDTPFAPRPCP